MVKVDMIMKNLTALTLSAVLALNAAPVAVFADEVSDEQEKVVAVD